MTDRPRMACYRVIVPATLAALLAAAPLAAQGPRPAVTSGLAQVQLSATMLPTAHLQGSSQMVGWRRTASGQEGVATLAVLPNAPYRLVVFRVDGETAAVGRASRRVWVAIGDSTLQEVRPGTPVVIRGSGATQVTEQQVTLRVRVGLGEATDRSSEVPLRYEIQVEPTL
jgi:hypothetical protein